jgi:hypothetical protein
MARDYEDIHNIDTLDDRELRDLVREQLSSHGMIDINDITVTVDEGMITLSGRVGTDGERRVADHVISDVLGIVEFTNDLVVDPIARGISPLAIDDHLADEEARSGTLLGEMPESEETEAAYMGSKRGDDLAGTRDYEAMMENGLTYNPPDGPTPEGIYGTDAERSDMGEQH